MALMLAVSETMRVQVGYTPDGQAHTPEIASG